MKRILFVSLLVVCVCMLMVIPAFASEVDTYTINFANGSSWDGPVISEGYYTAILYIDGDDNPIVFDTPFFVKGDGACYRLNSFEYDNETWTPQFCVMEEATTFDISHSDGRFLEKNGRIEFIPASAPAPEPEPDVDTLGDIGAFFSIAVGWIGSVVAIISARPAFLILVFGISIVLFAVGFLRRVKNL